MEYFDLSIPIRFNADQPNVYGVDQAISEPCEYGDFVGDTRRGGSVNFEQYTFIPHCNGTHTECVGHLTNERISIRNCLQDVLSRALLVTVEPENANDSGENYPYDLENDDQFITQRALEAAFQELEPDHTDQARTSSPDPFPSSPVPLPRSLVVRTLPNDDSKLTRKYDRLVPPFFSNEAMAWIVNKGFTHLLSDLPSIDRLYDKGKLSNHRIFWNVDEGSSETNKATRVNSTITELIYAADEIKDGDYLLNLQIAPFVADAAPSRPLLITP